MMILPSAFAELLVELVEFELEVLPRSAIELSMNDEMIDCTDSSLVDDFVPDVVPEELGVPAVSDVIKLWNADVRLDVTLLDALEPPFNPASNSLLPDSVAKVVSAATVEATLAVELAATLAVLLAPLAEDAAAAVFCAEAAPVALNRLDNNEDCPLPMLPIDIMIPPADPGHRVIGRHSKNLKPTFCCGAPIANVRQRTDSYRIVDTSYSAVGITDTPAAPN